MNLLDWIFGWMIVPDKLPEKQAEAIFCHTYGLTPNFKRLTAVGQSAIEKAVELVLKGKAQYLILPVAFYGENEEKKIKRGIAEKSGIAGKIIFLRGAKSTYDELFALSERFASLDSVIIVADRYHMRRSLRIFRHCFPEAKLYRTSSACLKYDEPARENSLFCYIQSRQIRYKIVSILWNIIFYLLTPLTGR